ncbi:sensor histidine kinase [Dasania marina]|uniref:sensor histidine kinase n=1 Tax=Dasania marina TaxID=471499 RepID=UPI0003746608|nr:HAMP domain-containing sensor histidine kinase [Dasania marina]
MTEDHTITTLNKSNIIIGTALGWAGIHIITMIVRSLKIGTTQIFTISPITVLVCLLLCYALKNGLSEKWAATLLLINISIPLLIFSYHSGGFKGPVIYLMSILPLMAFLLIDKKTGWLFCGLTISCFAFFAYLNFTGYPLPDPKIQGNALHVARAFSISFLVFLISWIGWLYQNTYQQFIQSIANKNSELIKKDEYKSHFISHMSHEFRTPLTAILGFSKQLLKIKKDQTNDREIEALKAIHRGGKNLLNMVNNTLDMAQIESGNLSCIKSSQNIAKLVNNAITDINILAENKQLSISIGNHLQSDTWVNADAMKIKQAFNNILANAIKYTQQGGIDITLSLYSLGDNDYVAIAIADTGVGIEADEIDDLFSRFVRLKKHAGSSIDGSGLGLSIANELVQLHDGHIEITSTVNKGSCFSIYLPVITNSTEQAC